MVTSIAVTVAADSHHYTTWRDWIRTLQYRLSQNERENIHQKSISTLHLTSQHQSCMRQVPVEGGNCSPHRYIHAYKAQGKNHAILISTHKTQGSPAIRGYTELALTDSLKSSAKKMHCLVEKNNSLFLTSTLWYCSTTRFNTIAGSKHLLWKHLCGPKESESFFICLHSVETTPDYQRSPDMISLSEKGQRKG